MPTKDLYHDTVKAALQKDGWQITDDPLFMRIGKVEMYIDLGAEKLLAAEKDGHKIAIEIKSFSKASAINEFHSALGQFMTYRLALKKKEPDRVLYLAIPADVHESFFSLPFPQMAIQEYELKLLVYHPLQEVIVQWLP